MIRRKGFFRFFTIGFLIITLIGGIVTAYGQERKIIKVGVFDYEAYYGEETGGEPYGYGYAYLDALAKHGGFEFEYVHGTWTECLAWLESGEIDILDSAQKNEDREGQFLFSKYSTGTSYGGLYVQKDNEKVLYNDFEAINGMLVGLLEGNSRNQVFFDFAEANGFSVKPMLFQTAESLSLALQEGRVDGIVSSNLRQGKNEKAVARFAPTPFYIMLHPDNIALKEKIDVAMEKILLSSPNFNAELNEKYYGFRDGFDMLTKEELAYIQSAPAVKVAFCDSWGPFVSYNETEEYAEGINVNVLNLVGEKTGLHFEYLRASSYDEAMQMVIDGDADLLLEFEAVETETGRLALLQTDPFLSVPVCLVGKSPTVSKDAVFVVPRYCEEMIWILREQFPDSSITVKEDIEECYQAVMQGRADFTMDNIYTAAAALGIKDTGLMISFISPVKDYYCFGLAEDMPPVLISIINKGIGSVSELELSSIFTKYTVNKGPAQEISTLIEEYRPYIITAVAGLITAILCAVVLTIYKRKKQKRQMWISQHIDSFTGIGNLNLFLVEAQRLLDKNNTTQYVICRFDIENMKLLNEIYGYERGDWIIQSLAKRIGSLANPQMDTYARIGSDHFVVLKNYIYAEDTIDLIEEFERDVLIEMEKTFDGLIKLKFGIYYIEDNKENMHVIMEKVNYAHSICKTGSTTNKHIYDEALKQSAIEEKKNEARMEEALSKKQFILYLQPKYRLADESLAGAEALARWKMEDSDELVYPNSFIPLFEKNGFITKLDMYMLERSCEVIHDWMKAGETPVTISINFSRLHLRNPDFTKEICAIVDRFEVPRNYIEVELTESTMFNNEDVMLAFLENLHEEGFTLSMDDFGTGYSSLGLLKNLPVDVIKIDRSFFLNSRFKTRTKAVIENVMQMAKRLEINTVAEGVECQEDIDMLREMGCEIVQGYYYSRPVSAAEFKLQKPINPAVVEKTGLQLDAWELGDISLGRGVEGEVTSVYAYRLFQTSLRKLLNDMYGTGEMIYAFRSAGKLAGSAFAKEWLDLSLPFDDFILAFGKKLSELHMGHLAVERFNLENGGGILTITGDLDCSGKAACNETLCQYDEGFIAGALKEYTKRTYSVIEVDCWGTGAAICRFEVRPK